MGKNNFWQVDIKYNFSRVWYWIFQEPVTKHSSKTIEFSPEETDLIDNEVLALLDKGAIVESKNVPDQFISNLFLVKKKNGKFRPVINLKGLNKFIKYFHFKQENLNSVIANIKQGDYFTSIDLCDAYFSIGIKKECRKYLKFVWKNVLYEFTCLCFGISTAPRVFTKVMKVIFSHIRNYGISSYFL